MRVKPVDSLDKSLGIAQSENSSIRGARSFSEVLQQQRGTAQSPFELSPSFITMSKTILSGGQLTLPQMLQFQVQANQVSLRVELASKAADGLLASVRKLQQQQ